MSFAINGIDVSQFFINGVEVSEMLIDGVEVYTSVEPDYSMLKQFSFPEETTSVTLKEIEKK